MECLHIFFILKTNLSTFLVFTSDEEPFLKGQKINCRGTEMWILEEAEEHVEDVF